MNRAKAIARNFIKQKDLAMWHHWAFDEKLTDVMFDDPGHQCDYLHAMRMDISQNTDWVIKELEDQFVFPPMLNICLFLGVTNFFIGL